MFRTWFRAFDFDGSAAWREYRNRLELPAGRDVPQSRYARWYKQHVDPDIDIGLLDGCQPTASCKQPDAAPGLPHPPPG